MQIGPHKLANNLVLAPMAGVTDRPFRALCRRLGAGLAVSEMVSADTSLWGSRKSLRRLAHAEERAPVAVQIVGNDPTMMAEAARRNRDLGADIIDINMGCPAKKVCKRAAGSALMRDEPLVASILEQTVAAVDVPVTLKIRTGWDAENRNAPRIARLAEQAGIAALAVHGRTRACGFSGQAEYDTIAKVKAGVGIPVFANGDIDSPTKAARVLARTGADGVLIGRAAQGRPWIFREIEHFLRTGELLPEPSIHWVRDVLLEHLEGLYDLYGSEHGVRVARKHIGWYLKARPGSARFRAQINRVESATRQRDLIEGFFDQISFASHDTQQEGIAA